MYKLKSLGIIIALTFLFWASIIKLESCSTFMLKHTDKLIFGHNLDQPGMKVSGYVFINKRSVFKKGCTLSELLTKDRKNPSTLNWISKYGSVSFNSFGKDLIDGGLNEEGLYIWEMSNVLGKYGSVGKTKRLFASNWMQYILDNYKNVEQVIQSVQEMELDGPAWHFFIGDKNGNYAAIEYLGGKTVIHQKEEMPIPALFNMPYDIEMEKMSYYQGFGGRNDSSLDNLSAGRFVHTAVMLKDYSVSESAVKYGFKILEQLSKTCETKWSVIIDALNGKIYFKTEGFQEIKTFELNKIDFSNQTPVLILDMDIKKGGDVSEKFSQFTDEKNLELVRKFDIPFNQIMPDELTNDECIQRVASFYKSAEKQENQIITGVWKAKVNCDNPVFNSFYPNLFVDDQWTLTINSKKDAISGTCTNSKGELVSEPIENLELNNDQLSFTLTLKKKYADIRIIVQANKDVMTGQLIFNGLPLMMVEFIKQ